MRIAQLTSLLMLGAGLAAAAPASVPKAPVAKTPAQASTTHAQTAKAPAETPGGPRTRLLANGLHVAIAPDSSVATVDVSLWFPVGSREERAGRTGLTQLVNGMMFAGSRRFPPGEHQRLIEREGGTTNVFSLADFACLSETVPPSALELALRLEADRVGAASLDASSLEAVRGTIERGRRDPAAHSGVALGMQKLYDTAFSGHPYHWPAGGLEADLPRITLDDARAWWRDRFGPDGTWLVIAGRVDADSAEALARRTLGAVPRRGLAHAAVAPPAPQSAVRRARGRLEGSGRVLLVGWRTPAARSADAAAMNVMDALLTHRRPSRIESTLLADTSRFLAVQAGFDQRRDAGLLFVAVLIASRADSGESERAVIDAVERTATSPIPAEELDAAVRQLEVESLFGWQTPAGLGGAIGRAAMLTGSASAGSLLESVKRLTPETLRSAAARSLTSTHRTVVWMLPGDMPGAASPGTAPPGLPGSRKGGR